MVLFVQMFAPSLLAALAEVDPNTVPFCFLRTVSRYGRSRRRTKINGRAFFQLSWFCEVGNFKQTVLTFLSVKKYT